MGKRKALEKVEPNTLSRGLPRLNGANRTLMHTRQFASTSKTPKTSNRGVATSTSDERAPSTTGSTEKHEFVTTRTRRPALPSHDDSSRRTKPSVGIISFPSLESGGTAASTRTLTGNSRGNTPSDLRKTATRWRPFPQVEPQQPSSDEDMDVRSDSDELMESSTSSLERSPPSNLNRQLVSVQVLSPTITSNLTFRGMSREDGAPTQHGRVASIPIQGPPHPELTDEYLMGVRDAPADDPAVLEKILYGTTSLLGVEIGGTDPHQEPSVDGSELTSFTFLTEGSRRAAAGLMPSFPPRDPVVKKAFEASSAKHRGGTPEDEDPSTDDSVEEWSLPDGEIGGRIPFEIEGKKYFHPQLPPGYKIKISKSHPRPIYLPPDGPASWWCPIPLKPKSEALRLKRSSLETKDDQGSQKAVPVKTRPVDAVSPHPHRSSFDASMSDVIKDCAKIRKISDDGYEASLSSRGSMESSAISSRIEEPSCPGVNEVSNRGGASDCPEGPRDWVTPLRSGITTPKESRPAPTKKPSTPALSPIEEDERVSLLADDDTEQRQDDYVSEDSSNSPGPLGAPSNVHTDERAAVRNISDPSPTEKQSEGEKSTPRVSFEPLEIARGRLVSSSGRPREAAGPSSDARSQNSDSPRPRKSMPEASTPVSDSDDADDSVKANTQVRNVTTEVTSLRHSSKNIGKPSLARCAPMYTPTDTLAMDTSTVRDAPVKRKSLQSISLSKDKTPLGDQRPNEDLVNGGANSLLHCDDETVVVKPLPASLPSRKAQSTSDPPALRALQPSSFRYESSQRHTTTHTPQVGASTEFQSKLEFEDDVDFFEREPDEWSPLRTEKPTPPSHNRENPGLGPSPESVAFEMNDDAAFDDHSFPAENEANTPSPSIEGRYERSEVHVPSIQSENDDSRVSRQRRAFSFLSSDLDDATAESIQAQPVDDRGCELQSLLSPPPPRHTSNRRAFSWRVLHPFHPLCALQRLDILLEAQRKRTRKTNRQKGRGKTKKTCVRNAKKTRARKMLRS